MEYDGTPDGQMELRLEACQDAGFTGLTVEADSTVTAVWDHSGDSFWTAATHTI
ncbi:hypothetical protein [Arthrobacter sp. UYCo732]|uniref:hypothetical protein n=1 Tax=Arthrobacter sp. UYCo732 TaxID=3156336 RepID=UPI00339144D7